MENIRNKDLNLLRVFVIVAEELNLSRASKRLGLSQPALSHSLSRLRDQFNDPLFTRGQRGLFATPRVAQLLPQARAILLTAENLYEAPSPLNLLTVKRKFSLASTTYVEMRILNRLVHSLDEMAPGVVLETYSLSGGFPKGELETGQFDIAIAAYFTDLPESFKVKTLFKDTFVCVASPKNRYHRSSQKMDDYLSCRHLQIDVPPGVVAPVDQYLSQKKKKRKMMLKVGNFLTPASIMKDNPDLVLTCPLSLAQGYTEMYGLEISELPFKLPSLETKMVWHERNHRDAFHGWMRETISNLV